MRLFLSDDCTMDMSSASTIKALDPNPRIYLKGLRTDIMKWLYLHKNLEIRNALGNVQVMLAQSRKTFAQEYTKAVANAVPGIGTLAKVGTAGSAAAGMRMKGSPGRVRSALDHAFGSKYWVTLDAGGNLHPNPYARQTLLQAPTRVSELIVAIEGMGWG